MFYWQEGEWWLPDGETHLQEWMTAVNDRRFSRLNYQGAKYRVAVELCKHKRNAIDVGAHIGLWSWQMQRDFQHVIAFEPSIEHRECYKKNCNMNRASLIPSALGDKPEVRNLINYTKGSTGDSRLNSMAECENNGQIVIVETLDRFRIRNVDLIKIDCEGFEYFVIKGGLETIDTYHPVMIVEQKEKNAKYFGDEQKLAIKELEGLGAKVQAIISGDYIMSWP